MLGRLGMPVTRRLGLSLRLGLADAVGAAIGEPDLPQALPADRAAVQTLRDAVGAITTFLKTEMYTLLGFEESVIPTDTDS